MSSSLLLCKCSDWRGYIAAKRQSYIHGWKGFSLTLSYKSYKDTKIEMGISSLLTKIIWKRKYLIITIGSKTDSNREMTDIQTFSNKDLI